MAGDGVWRAAGFRSGVIASAFKEKIDEVPSLTTGLAGTKVKPVGNLLRAESVIGA